MSNLGYQRPSVWKPDLTMNFNKKKKTEFSAIFLPHLESDFPHLTVTLSCFLDSDPSIEYTVVVLDGNMDGNMEK